MVRFAGKIAFKDKVGSDKASGSGAKLCEIIRSANSNVLGNGAQVSGAGSANEAPALIEMERHERPVGRNARDNPLGERRQARNLQSEVNLVGPKPGNRVVFADAVKQAPSDKGALILSVPPGLQAQTTATEQGVRKRGAISRSINERVVRLQPAVDRDPVIERQAGSLGKACFRNRADAGDNEIGEHANPVGELSLEAFRPSGNPAQALAG